MPKKKLQYSYSVIEHRDAQERIILEQKQTESDYGELPKDFPRFVIPITVTMPTPLGQARDSSLVPFPKSVNTLEKAFMMFDGLQKREAEKKRDEISRKVKAKLREQQRPQIIKPEQNPRIIRPGG